MEVATARRIEVKGRNVVKKRTLNIRSAKQVPASQELDTYNHRVAQEQTVGKDGERDQPTPLQDSEQSHGWIARHSEARSEFRQKVSSSYCLGMEEWRRLKNTFIVGSFCCDCSCCNHW